MKRTAIIFRHWGICVLAAALFAGGAAGASAAIYSPEGRPLIQTYDYAGTGEFDELDGPVSAAQFRHPRAVLALEDGAVLVADTANHRIRIIRNGDTDVFAGIAVSVLFDDAGLPAGALRDGPADLSLFNHPMGLARDAEGNVYVADAGNHAVRKIAPDGTVTTLAGSGVLGHADGAGGEARFYWPSDVAVDAAGNVYVADTLNHAIRKIDPSGRVTTLNKLSERVAEVYDGILVPAGDFADGPLAEALFNEPSGIAVDARGNLYVSDTGNQRIRYIDLAAGTVTTVAGGGDYAENALYVEGFYVDGPAEEARFYGPRGLAVDAEGGVYIADSLNHSIRYLKDGTVLTVAGSNGEYGSRNGIDERALLDFPADVALDAAGDLIVADMYNNKIRKIEFYRLPEGWSGDGTVRVLLNNRPIEFDVQPVIRSDRTMVPVRAIAEALGYDVEFSDGDIILTGGAGTVSMSLGKREVARTADGATVVREMDVAPYEEDGRTFVPVRFFAEEIGIDVDWHQETTTVILRNE